MGGSKPKAPKSETTTVVKQPDAPDPIFFQTIVPRESYQDVEYDINYARIQAGDLERDSDMMGLSPQALGIQEAKTQAIQDAAYASSLPGGLSGSVQDAANKQAADSAANLEQVKKDAAGYDRKYTGDDRYNFGPANRDESYLDFTTADTRGGEGGRRRRRDDDDGGRRRRGRRDDKNDKDKDKDKDKKGKRKKASRFAYYFRGGQTGHPDGRSAGRKGLHGTPFKVYRKKKGGRIRAKNVSKREFYRKSEQMRWKRKADKSARRARAQYVSKRYSRFKKWRGKK